MKQLQENSPASYERYKADNENSFLFFPAIKGLDGQKVGVISDEGGAGKSLETDMKKPGADKIPDLVKLDKWWKDEGAANETKDKEPVGAAVLTGGRAALKITAFIPLTMAFCYLILILYFKAKGGYKQVHIEDEVAAAGADL